MSKTEGRQIICVGLTKTAAALHLTRFVKVPLPPLPKNAVSPGWCAALLTGVVIL